MSVRNIVRYQLPPVLWAIVIFAESSVPGPKIPALPSGSDKVVHAFIYFVFCGLVYRWLASRYAGRSMGFELFLAEVATILYGLSDEFHQMYVPGRTADILDVTADACGGVLFILAILFVAKTRKKNADLETRRQDL